MEERKRSMNSRMEMEKVKVEWRITRLKKSKEKDEEDREGRRRMRREMIGSRREMEWMANSSAMKERERGKERLDSKERKSMDR